MDKRILIRNILRNILKVMWIFPVKTNRILLSSYDEAKAYNCNPKYITEYLLKNADPDEFEIVWAFKDPTQVNVSETIKKIKAGSIAYIYYYLTSKFIIYNVHAKTYLPKRKKQIILQTWHGGGGYKTVTDKDKTLSDYDLWRNKFQNNILDYFISSCGFFTETNIIQTGYNGKVLKIGMPRNDIFFDKKRTLEADNKVRKQLDLQKDDFVILFAPTFRGNFNNIQGVDLNLPIEDFKQAISKKHNTSIDKVKLLFRAHNLDLNRYDESQFINVSDYDDMQELLCSADILITDYSSSIWDYALTGKPCILYVPDYEKYKEERGFFLDIEEWPGIIARNGQQLIQVVQNLDPAFCLEKAHRHLLSLQSYENGKACKMVLDLLRQSNQEE